MQKDDFPDELSLRYRVHVLGAYVQSTLTFASEIADEGSKSLDENDQKSFDHLADYLEHAWIEAEKLRKRLKRKK
jgi:hypothetical protein